MKRRLGHFLAGAAVLVLACVPRAPADPITYPTSWLPNEVLNAADLNGNFAAVQAAVNGNLDSNNLKPTAAIKGTQLANAPNGVPTSKINDGAVSTSKIDDDAITLAKMAPNSVNSETVVDASIQSVDLADGTITSADLGPDSVAPDNVKSLGQFDGYCLAYQLSGDTWQWVSCRPGIDLSVEVSTAAFTQVADIEGLTLAQSTTIGWAIDISGSPVIVVAPSVRDGSIGSTQITDNSITSTDIGTAAVDTDELVDGAVTAAKLAETYLTSATSFFGTCDDPSFLWEVAVGGFQDVCEAASSYTAGGGPVVGIAQCSVDVPVGIVVRLEIDADGVRQRLVEAENQGSAATSQTLTAVWAASGYAPGTLHTVKLQVSTNNASNLSFTDCILVFVEFN